MRYDFSPLFRSSIGFDRLSHLVDGAMQHSESQTYPPYNIERYDGNHYRISMAVAGFAESDLTLEQRENRLVIKGKINHEAEQNSRSYLHRGIAGRAFQHSFQIADHIHVTNAALENGMLHIDLVQELPEEVKPRQIPISVLNTVPRQIDPEIETATV